MATRAAAGFRICGVALLVGGACSAYGQEAGVFGGGLPTGVLDPRPGLNLGRFNFHGGISGSIAYDDFASISDTGEQQDDFTWMISPYGSVATEGPNNRSIMAVYQPGFLFFLEETDQNAINHTGSLQLRWPFNRLTLRLDQRASVSSVVVRDVGNRTMQTTFGTEAGADYELSHKTTLRGRVSYSRTSYDEGEFFGSHQFSEELGADYRYNDQLSLGAGASFFQLQTEDGPWQYSEGPFIRAGYTPTPRLKLQAQVGVQFQQYETSDAGTVSPTFQLDGTYEIRPGTLLTVIGSRTEQPSALAAGLNYSATQVSATLRQTFLSRFNATLGAGYTWADYYATESGQVGDRSDHYYFIRSAINYGFTGNWTAGIFYDHTGNTSKGATSFDYEHNVVGLQASWSF